MFEPASNPAGERLAFVLPDLSGGGAARVASVLCSEWVQSGVEVHLITFEEPGTKPVYPLNDRIARHQVGLGLSPKSVTGFIRNNAARAWRVRKVLRRIRPTAIVSFLLEANSVAVVAGVGLGVPVLISERNHPEYNRISRMRELLRRVIYPRATRLCVQTEDIRAWFAAHLKTAAAVIPNPVPASLAANVEQPTQKRRTAVSLGRLEPQKGHDRLIDAFALIADKVPDWDVVIYGEGGLRGSLERQIQTSGLEGRVSLPGETRFPSEMLRDSSLYVHSARYEGSPNAVLEAMSAGLCIVATDCPGATGEILQRGANGLLVPGDDNAAFADAMLVAMQSAELRVSYGARARNAIRAYAPDKIARRWLAEIAEARTGTT